MARARDPGRLDAVIAAATWAFTELGFRRARISQVAERARVGPGTVYLYVQDKDALFEVAVLRAVESPRVAEPELPYRKTPAAEVPRLIEDCLHEIAHFPQLWVGSERRGHERSGPEYEGILRELARWIVRYRDALRLAERNRIDQPVLADAFDRIVWADLHRRLTGYLGSRMRTRALAAIADPAIVSRFAIDALVATLALGPTTHRDDPLADEDAIVRLVAAGVMPSGNRAPLPAHPGQHSTI